MEQPTLAPSIKTDFLFFGARFFERMAYYGFRGSVMSFYIYNNLSKDAYSNFHVVFFIYGSIIMHLIGGALGDFVFGSKRATVVGGIVFATGLILGCIPNFELIYVSFGLIVLGEGLFTPNFYAFYGKHYMSRLHFLDSRLTAISIFTNIGAFLAPIILGYFNLISSHNIAINLSIIACAMLIATFLVYQIPTKIKSALIDSSNELLYSPETKTERLTENRSIRVDYFVLLALIFYLLMIFSNMIDERLNMETALSPLNMELLLSIPISLVFIFIWNKVYVLPVKKLLISGGLLLLVFILSGLSLTFSLKPNLYIMIFVAGLVAVMEVFRYPVFHSMIFHYINPKYFGISAGAGKLLAYIFGMLLPFFFLTGDNFISKHLFITGTVAISLCLGVLLLIYRRKLNNNTL